MDVKTPDLGPAFDQDGAADADAQSERPGLNPPTPDELGDETPAEATGAGAAGESAKEAAAGGPAPAPPGEDTEAARLYKDRWLRAEAELQNFRRRAQRDLEEARQFAEERMLLTTLEHLDDLERALESARAAGASESWAQGIQLVMQRMRDALARHGVTEIEAVRVPFDPAVHEALLEVDAPEGVAPGQVVEVVRKGYVRRGRALRPARVIVARRSD